MPHRGSRRRVEKREEMGRADKKCTIWDGRYLFPFGFSDCWYLFSDLCSFFLIGGHLSTRLGCYETFDACRKKVATWRKYGSAASRWVSGAGLS